MFGVEVQNVGRLPAVVSSVGLGTKSRRDRRRFESPSPDLPYTVDVSVSPTGFVSAVDIARVLDASSKSKVPTSGLIATVGLGNGTSEKSKPAPTARALEQLKAVMEAE